MDDQVRNEQLHSDSVHAVALVRGEEHYFFVFDPKRRTELLRLLGSYAADPALSFTWYDAAVLSQKIRELVPAIAPNQITALIDSKSEIDSKIDILSEDTSPSIIRPSSRFELPPKN